VYFASKLSLQFKYGVNPKKTYLNMFIVVLAFFKVHYFDLYKLMYCTTVATQLKEYIYFIELAPWVNFTNLCSPSKKWRVHIVRRKICHSISPTFFANEICPICKVKFPKLICRLPKAKKSFSSCLLEKG